MQRRIVTRSPIANVLYYKNRVFASASSDICLHGIYMRTNFEPDSARRINDVMRFSIIISLKF